jgi:ferric-dicitrate binding protein FerR (iron transport regulator)
MANLRQSRPVLTGLQPAAPPRRASRARWTLIGAAVLAGLLVLAWFDGGEEPLRPITTPVALPGQSG